MKAEWLIYRLKRYIDVGSVTSREPADIQLSLEITKNVPEQAIRREKTDWMFSSQDHYDESVAEDGYNQFNNPRQPRRDITTSYVSGDVRRGLFNQHIAEYSQQQMKRDARYAVGDASRSQYSQSVRKYPPLQETRKRKNLDSSSVSRLFESQVYKRIF